MRILVAHNFYKQSGGEDQCMADEVAMLKSFGHEVTQYSISNKAIDSMSGLQKAARTIWNRPAFGELRNLFRSVRPQLAHFHNTFPLISPAAYYAARAENVAVVQTLHNFRLHCTNALFFREGQVCEKCLGKPLAWRGVVHKCYRGDPIASLGVASMVAAHRILGTWRSSVDAYIALTEFSKRKFVQGGLPADKIMVKPNFAYPDPGLGTGLGGYAIYVGRLSSEKGINALLEAWQLLEPAPTLKIVGDGPLAGRVREAATQNSSIQYLGAVAHRTIYDLIGEAALLVVPSGCYENFPRVIVEAFAKGTPVIGSKLGAMAEIIDDGLTGLHFSAGDAEDLAAKVRNLWTDRDRLLQMRKAARRTFEARYTARMNHQILMTIYHQAAARSLEQGPMRVAV
jgi:glycosyltransferase involved in cell wall biosynthesis